MPAKNPVEELITRSLLDKAPGGSYKTRYELFDQFERLPKLAATVDDQKNINWQLTGTNAADLDVTRDPDGGLNIVTAGADDDQVIVSPLAGSAAAATLWSPEVGSRMEVVIELPDVSNLLFHMGFGLTANLDLVTDDDQAKFEFSTEGALTVENWTSNDSIAGLDSQVDTFLAAAALRTINLAVEINTSSVARFYVDDILKVTTGTLTLAADLQPFFGIQALAAAAKTVKVRSIRVNRVHTDG